jgi:hypothetical protein
MPLTYQFGLSSSQTLESGLVTQSDPVIAVSNMEMERAAGYSLSGLHDQSQAAVDRVGGLLSFLRGHLCAQEVC